SPAAIICRGARSRCLIECARAAVRARALYIPKEFQMSETVRVIPLERLRMRDLAQVGGKNASLGEMIGELASVGIRVPGGFATTADAFREFLQQDRLGTRIEDAIRHLDVADVRALA